ncbi:MAG: hypothetical protein AAB758_03090 [Patescibacteria group bacterium]
MKQAVYLKHTIMNKRYITLTILIAILAAGFFLWQKSRGGDEAGSLFTEEAVNPFEENTNPYSDIKTNPFE